MIDLERRSFNVAVWVGATLALLVLTAPTVVVLVTSFTGASTLKFPPPEYSLRWYLELLDSRQLQRVAIRSFWVAAAATLIATALGTAAALALARSRAKWARALDGLFMSPLIVPWIAIGLSILMLVSLIGIPLSAGTLIAGHVVVCVPFVLRTTIASLAQLDSGLLESSASLGAGTFYTFRRITLPLIGRGIGAGAFLSFIASFDNVPVSLFLADARAQVLPIRMWQMLQADLDVRVASISAVLIVLTLLLMFVMERMVGLSRQMVR
jgi:putative spermidine/putrescine transport system permease protein